MTNAYFNMTANQIAAEYRAAYAIHQQLSQDYAEGRATACALQASASNLKAIRVAYAAEKEANQVRKH